MIVRSRLGQLFATAGLLACAILTRFPSHSVRPAAARRALFQRVDVPPPVERALLAACANCHSDDTRWPWYAYVPIASYFIQQDVLRARAHMNLSDWQTLEDRGPEELAAGFSGICENLLSGAMPKRSYVWLHPEARLAKTQISQVCEWADKRQMSALLTAEVRKTAAQSTK